MSDLPITREDARIFRITHIDNIEWILANGLHCSSSDTLDPNFKRIGNAELIEKRPTRQVPIDPKGNLGDYIPFYFTSRSPMLLNIKTGWNGIPQVPMPDIVIMATSLPRLRESAIPFVYADRHAYMVTAQFSSSLEDLDRIDWEILRDSDFQRDPNDPGKFDRYQAEALVHRHLPIDELDEIICRNDGGSDRLQQLAEEAGANVTVSTQREFFF